jgi:hypothetical protein
MDDKEPGFGDDLTDFGVPMDFQMPDFSAIGKTLSLFSWLPAVISSILTFIFFFIFLVVYNGIFNATYKMTYGDFMWMLMLPFVSGIVVLFLVRFATMRKMKKSPLAI